MTERTETHALRDDGAPFRWYAARDDEGRASGYVRDDHGDTGLGLCTCGSRSQPLTTTEQRQGWFLTHVSRMREQEAIETGGHSPDQYAEPKAAFAFRGDVERHTMTVEHDDGVFRHLRFAEGTDWLNAFRITTAPHHWMMTGDRGVYVFSRGTEDMMKFFGSHEEVNPGYWKEKLVASPEGRHEAVEEFSLQKYREAVAEAFPNDSEAETRAALLDELDPPVTTAQALERIYAAGYGDAFELDVTVYSFHFLWACHAAQYAARTYLASKLTPEQLDAQSTTVAHG